MHRLSEPKQGPLRIVSKTFPAEQIKEILSLPDIFYSGHFEYPAPLDNRRGNHLNAVFIIEPIAKQAQYRKWIIEDINRWLERENISFDVVLAPDLPAVKEIVQDLCKLTSTRFALWEYFPAGWFGDHLVEGAIEKGDRVLLFNGLSQTANCVGNRLPSFAKSLGGDVVGAAVFAKGSGVGITNAEKLYGEKLYASLQVDIKVETPADCQLCRKSPLPELVSWTKMRDRD